MDEARDPIRTVLDYHERTKHHLDRYARSLGRLDWANQPNPFLLHRGAELVRLVDPNDRKTPLLDELADVGGIEPEPVDSISVSALLWLSLALSAWKQAGAGRWSLRVNPSSGNLHPTEAYLMSGPIDGIRDLPAVYHYTPLLHGLEVRCELDAETWGRLVAGLPAGSLLVALTSVPWREAWKYGERAYRYCQHDVGHAIGALSYAAASLGWVARLLPGVSDDDVGVLTCSDDDRGAETEHADCLLLISTRPDAAGSDILSWRPDPEAVAAVALSERTGTPNRLSENHHHWPVIDDVVCAARSSGLAVTSQQRLPPVRPAEPRPVPAWSAIRGRRSAVEMDGTTSLSTAEFVRILRRLLAGPGRVPHSTLPWAPTVALVFWVHRVTSVDPGLYVLVREPSGGKRLEASLSEELEWVRPAWCEDDVPFFRLVAGDARREARLVSCHQDIAADGAFCVSMLAEVESRLRRFGAAFYRCLHWECGLVGQVLYLEAEAAGVRGTGIGCFFDDAVARAIGIEDGTWQCLYNFTVGGPVEDQRLTTLPAYAHLDHAEERPR